MWYELWYRRIYVCTETSTAIFRMPLDPHKFVRNPKIPLKLIVNLPVVVVLQK